MPTGMPINSETKLAATTRTRVSIISFHRPILRISSSPSRMNSATFQLRCTRKASAAAASTKISGGTSSSQATSPSIGMRRPLEMPSKNHS